MKREVPEGFHHRFTHVRAVDEHGVVQPKGGGTLCDIIEDSSGAIMASGTAWCNPEDNFSRPLGRRISEGRALKTLYAKAQEAYDAR